MFFFVSKFLWRNRYGQISLFENKNCHWKEDLNGRSFNIILIGGQLLFSLVTSFGASQEKWNLSKENCYGAFNRSNRNIYSAQLEAFYLFKLKLPVGVAMCLYVFIYHFLIKESFMQHIDWIQFELNKFQALALIQ